MTPMMSRFMAMMALALSASGCATGVDPDIFTGSVTPVAPALIADVAPEYAAAYLPQAAGGIEAVRQSSKAEQVFQTILYPNTGYEAGENSLSVSIAPRSSGKSYYQAPTRNEIIREMRAALPGVAMAMSPAPGQNLQGPFGYAIGRGTGGGSCIFAWQIAEDLGRAGQTGFGKLARKRYAAKLRLRYCHPTMSEAALVSLMSGVRVREVSTATIEMLRFAEGSGVPARQAYANLAAPAAAVAKPAKSARKTVSKPAKVAAASPGSNAARVLKPSELQASTGKMKDTPVTVARAGSKGKVQRTALKVPLPGDL